MTSDSDRLDRLEREISILRAEFAKLREHVGYQAAERAAPKTPPPPPRREYSPPPRPEATPAAPEDYAAPSSKSERSYEELIGAYGAPVLALLFGLLATGTFLGWAIQKGLLGPTARVVIGYLAAIGLAYGGMRLRMRGTRQFGNVILAMALAVVHLVCWSAGPLLHVLPSGVALAIGFVASVLLAEFALRHDEEMLCAIGFGGATIAPFVAGGRDGNRIALALYGVMVVALASAALGSRKWKYARGVAMWGVVLFTAMSGSGLPSESPPAWISARLWVLTPVLTVLAVIPFTHAEHRRSMVRMCAGALILGGLLRADQWNADLPALLITLVGTLVIIGALDATRPGTLEREAPVAAMDQPFMDRESLLDAFIIPVGLFIATVAATPDLTSFQSAAVAVVFAALAVYMTHRTRGEPEGGRYASTASLIALWIVPAAFVDQDVALIAGCTLMGMLLLFTARRMNRLPFVAGAMGSFAIASTFAMDALETRIAFEYVPFLTAESFGALIAVTGWIAGVRLVTPGDFLPEVDATLRGALREAFVIGGSLTAFFWGVFELDHAWNRQAGTSLLIVYYAATGALMIYLGRRYSARRLRIAGLTVALWGAWKALVEAFGMPNPGVRIAVFLAVGAFLIGIGYWYRRGGGEPVAATG